MTLAILHDYETPWYMGGGSSADVPGLAPVALNGHLYWVEFQKEGGYQRTTLPLLRQASDQGAETGEQSLNTEGFWLRHVKDWSYGAGQRTFDVENSNRGRFWSSKGVYVWEDEEITLLPEVELKDPAIVDQVFVLTVGDYLYLIEDNTVRFTADPTPSSPSWTTVSYTGIGSILSYTTDGSYLYVSDGTGIWRSAIGNNTAGAAWSTYDADMVSYANGRLLAADANILAEISNTGVGTALTGGTHSNAGFAWRKAVPAANGIYVFGNAGVTGEIYFIGINETTGALKPPIVASSLATNEAIHDLQIYANTVTLGTSEGFRMGQISNNAIDFSALIETDHPVQALTPDRNYIYYGLTNYDGVSTGIGRMAPGRFTDTLVPAYASDLMATAQGEVVSIASFGGRRYFTVEGEGLYGETLDKVETGTITSSWITFGTSIEKLPVLLNLRTEALAGSVAVSLEYGDGTTSTVGTYATADGMSVDFGVSRQNFDKVRVVLTFTRDTVAAETGPTVIGYTLRALPTGPRVDEIIVPLIISDSSDSPAGDGSFLAYDTLTEYRFLKDLESTQETVLYQEGESTYEVRIDRVQVKPYDWSWGKRFFNGLIIVRLLTLEV